MKKILSSLLAVVAVMCLALTFSSCEKDKDDVTIRVTWRYGVVYDENAPAEVVAEIKAVTNQIDARTREIFGEGYFVLEADADKARPTNNALHTTYDRFGEDSKIKSCIDQLKAINAKYGKDYVYYVIFGIYCGETLVGSMKYDISK